MAKLTIASYEETEERLKNEQYRLVFPLKLRKPLKTATENTDKPIPSQPDTRHPLLRFRED